MGVYSSLAAEMAADIIPVKEHVNPIQFAIDCHRDDLQLFEAMIERDISNAYCEAGIIVVNEDEKNTVDNAAKDGIIKKIKTLITKAIEMFKSLIANVVAKYTELAKTDKQLFDKFGFIEYDKIKDCPIKGKTINYKWYDSEFKTNKDLEKYINNIKKLKDDISLNSNFDNVRTESVEIKEKFDSLLSDLEKEINSKYINNDSETTIATNVKENIKYICSEIKSGYAEVLKNSQSSIREQIDNLKQELRKIESEEKNHATGTTELSKLQCEHSLINMEVYMRNKYLNLIITLERKRASVERANYIVLGNWLAKEKTSANKDEASVKQEAYILTEFSNEYVESIFNMI